MTTAVGLLLAILGAGCFAVAATLQHRAVQVAIGNGRFGAHTLRRLLRQPGWLTGVALGASGAGLNVAALFLAPVSLIQPVGVLAVPLAVVLAARQRRRAPSPGLTVGVLVTVLAVVGYVYLVAGTTVAYQGGASGGLLTAGTAATVTVALLALVATHGPHAFRCLASAAGGAISFGLMTVLVRVLTQLVVAGPAALLQPSTAALLAGVVAALLVGGWLVQQAFSTGPAELVLACLTVLDPLVAVLMGTLLLGEGAGIDTVTAWAMAGCAAVAAAGVVTIGRQHPDVLARRTPGPTDPGPAPHSAEAAPSRPHSRLAA